MTFSVQRTKNIYSYISMNTVSKEELQEYSQPKKNKFKRERKILLDTPERPKHLTGDDFAKIRGDISPLSPLRSRTVSANSFAKMEQDYNDFWAKNNNNSQIDMYKSNNKKDRYYSSNRIGFFETLYRYIRNRFFRNKIDIN